MQFICIDIIDCLCTINSSTLDVGIIASVCSLPNSSYQPEVPAPSLLEQHPRCVSHETAQDTTRQNWIQFSSYNTEATTYQCIAQVRALSVKSLNKSKCWCKSHAQLLHFYSAYEHYYQTLP